MTHASGISLTAQADNFRRLSRRGPSLRPAWSHLPSAQPRDGGFMADNRVVVRSHHDELCCVETVKFISKDSVFGADDVAYLNQFPHLVRLVFDSVAIDATALALLTKLAQLQHLVFSDCDGVDTAVFAEVSKLTQLQHLAFTSCDGVDAAGLAALGKLPQLRHLDLGSLACGSSAAPMKSCLRSCGTSVRRWSTKPRIACYLTTATVPLGAFKPPLTKQTNRLLQDRWIFWCSIIGLRFTIAMSQSIFWVTSLRLTHGPL